MTWSPGDMAGRRAPALYGINAYDKEWDGGVRRLIGEVHEHDLVLVVCVGDTHVNGKGDPIKQLFVVIPRSLSVGWVWSDRLEAVDG